MKRRPSEAPPSVAPPPHDATPATAVAPAARRRARAEHAQPPATEPTAAELFAAANAARRARDLRGAIDRYLALERRFPDTDEALVSLVSAADLLARLGESDGALRAFDRYLGRRPEGPLASEALFGRARALRQLGRRAEEIDAWRRLLRASSRIDLRVRRPPAPGRALAVTIGAPGAGRFVLLLLPALAVPLPSAARAAGDPAPSERAEITIVARPRPARPGCAR